MEDYDPTLYYDYDATLVDNSTSPPTLRDEYVYDNSDAMACFKEASCITLLVINVLIFLLGICGNGVVIWIAGCKMKTTVNTTWYLSLAISDFIFCAFLPFDIAHTVTKDWKFGLVMCKLSSFVMFLNMFSSIFLLVIISVDRCVSVARPVWAQNHRTIRKASVAVVLAWVVSVAPSAPAMYFRDIDTFLGKTKCYNRYTASHEHRTIAVSRFVAGFVIPLFIILICYSVIMARLRSSRMNRTSKPFKVMTALIGTFVLCWLPYHAFVLLELSPPRYLNVENFKIGSTVAVSMAKASSFLNPVLYVFMGGDFKQKFKSSVVSMIENAMGGAGHPLIRPRASVSGPVSLTGRSSLDQAK